MISSESRIEPKPVPVLPYLERAELSRGLRLQRWAMRALLAFGWMVVLGIVFVVTVVAPKLRPAQQRLRMGLPAAGPPPPALPAPASQPAGR
jgi:hypothetical protein